MTRPILTIVLAVLCVIVFAHRQSLAVDSSSSVQPGASVTVPFQAIGNSGQTGSATLTATADNKTQVVIALTGTPAGAQEPAHIHQGTCNKLDPKPTYPLTTVTAGASTTIVPVPLKSLQTGGYAINVHQSTTNIGTYVSCGNIPPLAPAAMPAPAATPEPMST